MSGTTGTTPTHAARDDYAGRLDELQSAVGSQVTTINCKLEYLEDRINGHAAYLLAKIAELEKKLAENGA